MEDKVSQGKQQSINEDDKKNTQTCGANWLLCAVSISQLDATAPSLISSENTYQSATSCVKSSTLSSERLG